MGSGSISGRFLRHPLLLLAFQMVGAASPLVLSRPKSSPFPFAPTLEGQYIIKNVVLVSAGLVIGATVRGGGLSAERFAMGHRPIATPSAISGQHSARLKS